MERLSGRTGQAGEGQDAVHQGVVCEDLVDVQGRQDKAMPLLWRAGCKDIGTLWWWFLHLY